MTTFSAPLHGRCVCELPAKLSQGADLMSGEEMLAAVRGQGEFDSRAVYSLVFVPIFMIVTLSSRGREGPLIAYNTPVEVSGKASTIPEEVLFSCF